MVNEFIFKDVCWFMICHDLKKSDYRPCKISPNTDVSVVENGPMLSNRRPIYCNVQVIQINIIIIIIHFLIT